MIKMSVRSLLLRPYVIVIVKLSFNETNIVYGCLFLFRNNKKRRKQNTIDSRKKTEQYSIGFKLHYGTITSMGIEGIATYLFLIRHHSGSLTGA